MRDAFRSNFKPNAMYHLDDVYDASGNGYTLTNNGSVAFAAGKFGNCADFGVGGGSSKFLSRADNLGLTLTQPLSVMGWFKVVQAPGANETQTIFATLTNGGNYVILFYQDVGGTKQLLLYRLGADTVPYVVTLTLGAWYHFAITSDGTNILLYLNGSIVVSTTKSGALSSGTVTYIGGYSGQNFTIRGMIDEIAVFQRKLDPPEIIRWANETNEMRGFFPLALYHLSDSLDSSGFGINLTDLGTVAYAAGKLGNCAQFGAANSTKQLYSAGLAYDLSGGGPSISAWIYVQTQPVTAEMQCPVIWRSTTTTDRLIGIFYLISGGIKYLRVNFGGNVYDYAITLDLNTWYHVVAVAALGAGAVVSLYLNGALLGTTTKGTTISGSQFVIIGGDQSCNTPFKGNVDEVAFFGRPLSLTEILALYNSGAGLELPSSNFDSDPNLTALYHMENVYDSSGNNNTLTNVGTITFSPGKFGNAAILGSANSTKRLSAANPCGLDISLSATVCGWFMIQTQPVGSEEQQIIDIRQTSPNSRYFTFEYRITSGITYLQCSASDAGTLYAKTLTLNIWYHFALIKNVTNYYLYLNGALVASGTCGTSAGGRHQTDIGASDSNASPMKGNLDEFAFFNVAKSAQWVRSQYCLARFGE